MNGKTVKKLNKKAKLFWDQLKPEIRKIFSLRFFQRAMKKSYYLNGRDARKAALKI